MAVVAGEEVGVAFVQMVVGEGGAAAEEEEEG